MTARLEGSSTCASRPNAAELTIEHQQVLAFVSSYLRHYGYLPTATEAALACGFRSSRPAARLLADLETFGVLRRQQQYTRLGSVEYSPQLPAIDEDDQLWLAERAAIEHRAGVVALRTGLDVAPDLDVVDAIHGEGVTRCTVLRAYQAASARLREGGATLTAEGSASLRVQDDVMAAAHALMADWPTYCVVQLVWALSARQWLAEIQPLQLGYLGASSVASLRALDSLLPTYRARASRALRQDPRVPDLLGALAELLGQLRQSIALHFPSPPNRLSVDVHALLAD